MPKNIVVLSDGTGQDGGRGHDSNIYKLFRMLEDRTENQIVFYEEGLGTTTQKLTGMAFGAGIDKNILQCYRFIFDNYNAGDKIFLFGFSRGAATVRSLASFIHYFGILPASRPELIEEAYRIYRNRKGSYHQAVTRARLSGGTSQTEPVVGQTEGTLRALDSVVYHWNDALRDDLDQPGGKSDEFVRKHPNQWVQIEFLGVWDTVPALGLIALPGLDALLDRVPAWKHEYHNFKLRGSVKHACHALSIDDERKWFYPSVWKEYDRDLTEKVEQVWFGGAHTDVGGGFWEAGFSDIALEWMVQNAFEHGIRLYFDSRPEWNFCVAPDATDDFHDPRSAWGVLYASGVRDKVWDEKAFETFGPPRVHETVLERARCFPPRRGNSTDPEYCPWILKPEVYPKADQIDAWLKKEYEEQWAPRAYKKWCAQSQEAGDQKALPALGEWMSQPENSFEKWMTDNDYVFEEFDGMKILVEKIKNVVYDPAGNALLHRYPDQDALTMEPAGRPRIIRDYDRDVLPEILRDAVVYKNLRDRVRKIDMKSAKLTRLQRKALEKDPTTIPYVYRIDRDAKRWNITITETPAGTTNAD